MCSANSSATAIPCFSVPFDCASVPNVEAGESALQNRESPRSYFTRLHILKRTPSQVDLHKSSYVSHLPPLPVLKGNFFKQNKKASYACKWDSLGRLCEHRVNHQSDILVHNLWRCFMGQRWRNDKVARGLCNGGELGVTGLRGCVSERQN